ncbi:MAG TPA: thiamine phosphate synthase [Pyrinomonadaceae bacterium]|nr:thiamine phosphate synthase [Pyrinomonadaceae bacterium]
MQRHVQPVSYLITSGATNLQTTPSSKEFEDVLEVVAAAAAANVSLIQLREKRLSPRVLFELTVQAAQITRKSETRLLVNDRADIARAAGAAGVHLTTRSLGADVVRRTFGRDFLIGASTHSLEDARAARDSNADFAVFGPVFTTESKETYGAPQGLAKLAAVARELAPFPIIALGGIDLDNLKACSEAGASGIAGISIFKDRESLSQTVSRIRELFKKK